ncbi:MAG: hypothetical protein JSU97_07935 [Dehalococcoidia bacterium]|nr:MAG: hypothetical protein JSU97_07935 [Dehalococcoidia bacterium]
MVGDGAPSTESGQEHPVHPAWVEAASHWVEIGSAILMAIALVGTSYSAWQSNRWGGVEATSFAQASSARTEWASIFAGATQEIAYDAITFGEFALKFGSAALEDPAVKDEAEALADLLMRDEFRVALDAWLALDPLNNPDAPKTPFDVAEYENATLTIGDELFRLAEEKMQEGKEANQNSDDYILATVFFASVVFFAGVAPKFRSINVRLSVLALSLVGLGFGLERVATLPFH